MWPSRKPFQIDATRGTTMKRTIPILAVLALLAAGATVHAQPALDFSVPGSNPGASIRYAGGPNPLVGNAVTVSQVQGLATPLHDLIIQAITNGTLSFTAGNFTGSIGGDWEFGTGPVDALTIVGAVPGAGLSSSTTLLRGTILSAKVDMIHGDLKVALAAFVNTINATLAAYYGVPTVGEGGFNISFNARATAPNGFSSSNVHSGDVLSTAVPAPGSLVLLCSGGAASLLGAVWRRKRWRPCMGLTS